MVRPTLIVQFFKFHSLKASNHDNVKSENNKLSDYQKKEFNSSFSHRKDKLKLNAVTGVIIEERQQHHHSTSRLHKSGIPHRPPKYSTVNKVRGL